MAPDAKELCEGKVENVQNLDRDSLIHGDFQVLNLRPHVTDFGHEFMDIFAVPVSNFMQLAKGIPFGCPIL